MGIGIKSGKVESRWCFDEHLWQTNSRYSTINHDTIRRMVILFDCCVFVVPSACFWRSYGPHGGGGVMISTVVNEHSW